MDVIVHDPSLARELCQQSRADELPTESAMMKVQALKTNCRPTVTVPSP